MDDAWIAWWTFDFNGEIEEHFKYWSNEREAYECISSVLSDCAYIGIRHHLRDFGAKRADDI